MPLVTCAATPTDHRAHSPRKFCVANETTVSEAGGFEFRAATVDGVLE
jgi:hypothetical protein